MKKVISLLVSLIIIVSLLPGATVSAMTPQEGADWALAQVGKWIDTDGAYGAQCVDLIVEYCRTNFGWNPQGSGNAEAYRTVKLPNSSWQRIKNTPEFIPQPGDIAIWNPAASNGYCGHVAIIISANINTFVSVDQNLKGSSNGSAAQKTTHNYNNFWGIIRPPFTSQSASTPTVTKPKTIDDGLYTLKNASSGYMMNIYAGKDANGTKVTTWEYDGTTDQRIYIQHKGDGKYLLKFNASSSGRVVDVNRGESLNASIDDGDKIDIWTADDLSAQYFWINNTGNNKYTFELASKPSHVIAAANSSAAASNGTQLELKYYTGAEYQKWYLCDTNGNVIGACTHNKTTNKTTNTAYNQKDESNHIVVTKYNMICSNCGETIKSNLSEEKTEPHIFSNNKCTKCNYEIVDNSQDEIEEPEETTEPEEQEKICAHTNTYQSKIKNSSVKIKNETHHSITETYDVICKDCNATVEKNLTGTRTEKHAFSDNLCSVCGYEKEIPNASFTDVTDVELAQTVASLSSLGIINGYEDGSFRPYNNITRAEFSKMICIAGKFQTTSLSSDNFEDVAQNHWARNYIYTAQRFGIINGISQTAFAPEANITYEQAIKMIVASLGYNDEAIQRGGYPNGYIEIAEELGILNGIYYRNTDYATRANIAKMIDAAMDIPFYVLNENNGTITKTYSRKSLYELHK